MHQREYRGLYHNIEKNKNGVFGKMTEMMKDAVNKGLYRYFTFPRNSFLDVLKMGKLFLGTFLLFGNAFGRLVLSLFSRKEVRYAKERL